MYDAGKFGSLLPEYTRNCIVTLVLLHDSIVPCRPVIMNLYLYLLINVRTLCNINGYMYFQDTFILTDKAIQIACIFDKSYV